MNQTRLLNEYFMYVLLSNIQTKWRGDEDGEKRKDKLQKR